MQRRSSNRSTGNSWNADASTARPTGRCGEAGRTRTAASPPARWLPDESVDEFVELLTSMDYSSPDIKEMMDLEHLRAWIPADESGWQDLVSGVKDAKLEGEGWGVTYVVAQVRPDTEALKCALVPCAPRAVPSAELRPHTMSGS